MNFYPQKASQAALGVEHLAVPAYENPGWLEPTAVQTSIQEPAAEVQNSYLSEPPTTGVPTAVCLPALGDSVTSSSLLEVAGEVMTLTKTSDNWCSTNEDERFQMSEELVTQYSDHR